jgi:membrane-bound ClpP family serine protease
MIPFILLALGLILILIEFYVPGAIMGTLGGILILSSIILFASESSSPIAIALFIIGTAISVGLLIRFALWRIVHAKPGYSIYSDNDQEGYQASSYDPTVIGKTGIVLSDLKPGGYIVVEGKQHQAISISGYISKGTEVIAVSGQEESLIVKLIKKESKP